jgi:hypothetical protein
VNIHYPVNTARLAFDRQRRRTINGTLLTLRTVFVAFLLDPVSRRLVEQGQFPDLRARDANLYGPLSALPQSEREALVRYLQTEVPLKDFDKAA